MEQRLAVVFVCLGNICRSPTADGVFRHHVAVAGLQDRIQVDSAGTGAWHIGEAPNERATATAAQRGYDLAPLRARKATANDFQTFDYVSAMDQQNLSDLRALAPVGHTAELALFLDFAGHTRTREVPDPYYGGDAGFDHVLDLVEDAAGGLLRVMKERLKA